MLAWARAARGETPPRGPDRAERKRHQERKGQKRRKHGRAHAQEKGKKENETGHKGPGEDILLEVVEDELIWIAEYEDGWTTSIKTPAKPAQRVCG